MAAPAGAIYQRAFLRSGVHHLVFAVMALAVGAIVIILTLLLGLKRIIPGEKAAEALASGATDRVAKSK